jgi:hypothetical protein
MCCTPKGVLAAQVCALLQAKHSTFAEARDAIALHLLSTLLGRADRSTVLSEHAQELLVAVPAVASFMVLDVQTASAPSTADEGKQPASAPAPPVPDMLDPAALQLEALYVLLLILSSPTPQVCTHSYPTLLPPSQKQSCYRNLRHMHVVSLALWSLTNLMSIFMCSGCS